MSACVCGRVWGEGAGRVAILLKCTFTHISRYKEKCNTFIVVIWKAANTKKKSRIFFFRWVLLLAVWCFSWCCCPHVCVYQCMFVLVSYFSLTFLSSSISFFFLLFFFSSFFLSFCYVFWVASIERLRFTVNLIQWLRLRLLKHCCVCVVFVYLSLYISLSFSPSKNAIVFDWFYYFAFISLLWHCYRLSTVDTFWIRL